MVILLPGHVGEAETYIQRKNIVVMHGMTRGRKEDIANYKTKTIQIGATGASSFQFKRHHLSKAK